MIIAIKVTPEMRIRLMCAETIKIDVSDSCAVPEGWQLVPVAPTVPMLAAFAEFGGKAIKGYKAMLAAAPQHKGGDI